MASPRKQGGHFLWVAILWIVLTVAGEWLVLSTNLIPGAAAEEAQIVDSAFRLLTILAVPVMAFVLAALLYSVLRFRSRAMPEQDGPALPATRRVVGGWLAITSALSIYVIINPGLIGLAELHDLAHRNVDLVVQVEGQRWQWQVTYPEHDVKTHEELVLPLGKHVRFDITSVDVLHSFWVPAFRMKIDAVPGQVTSVWVTPNQVGTAEQDHQLRLVCAELCGLGHTIMAMPVRVVEPPEFDTWIAGARQQ
ncbi:MAG: cytochrome c oxidase subunit II [Dehalococcoidia bacterium]|nr:cytochrome c oxidase subunit II [Dehalococcoidia bacterium]